MMSMNDTPGDAQTLHFDEIETVQQMSPDDAREAIAWRVQQNMRETRHPFHHKTANGTIIDTDPTLKALLARLTDAARAVPVIHDWYKTDAGMAFLRSRFQLH